MKHLFKPFVVMKKFKLLALGLTWFLVMPAIVLGFELLPLEPNPALSLKNDPLGNLVPQPPDLQTKYVTNKTALIALGKALFWDTQVGSDGQACASCHFHAGSDNRSKNQLSPGLRRALADTTPNQDTAFTSGKGPNYQLTSSDFPFHKLQDPLNRNSTVLQSNNDVVSSQGAALRIFNRATSCNEETAYFADEIFKVSGTNTRRAEPRNTPSVINAVFNHRNFWDGRAQDIFNGVNIHGDVDLNAHLYVLAPDLKGPPVQTRVRIEQSSLASQAVGPPGNDIEMSARGRPFVAIGKKLTGCKPLAKQLVHPDDSVLGSLSNYNKLDSNGKNTPGIAKVNYSQMIREAFRPEWWKPLNRIQINADGTEQIVSLTTVGPNVYSLEEYNFSLFFGLALQAYQATLISHDTPWDRYNMCAKSDTNCQNAALTSGQRVGAQLFFSDKARCSNCHRGRELTDASVSQIVGAVKLSDGSVLVTNSTAPLGKTRFRTFDTYRKDSNGNLVADKKQIQLIDTGYNNIGVRPTLGDLGVGSKVVPGPYSGIELSYVRQCMTSFESYRKCLDECNAVANSTDLIAKSVCKLPPDLSPEVSKCFDTSAILGVDGAVKIPGLRNVTLTAPYFHNGGARTLDEVLDFYMRGGNKNPTDVWSSILVGTRLDKVPLFPLVTLAGVNFDHAIPKNTSKDVCLPPNSSTVTTPITSTEKTQLVMFLAALTDERVRYHKAPFDHPQLIIPNGHTGTTSSVIDINGYAQDDLKEIKAVGRNGYATPLPNFIP